MASVRENLIAARKLIEDQRRWTKGTMARDCRGNIVEPGSEHAFCFCSMGAISRIRGDNGAEWGEEENLIREAAIGIAPVQGGAIIHVNDVLGHAAVLRMFDSAIERAPA